MQYGYFDNEKREYVIDNVALPCSWTNYLGVEDMAAVINHTAGGYLFYKTPEYHRISRFRGNGVPMDGRDSMYTSEIMRRRITIPSPGSRWRRTCPRQATAAVTDCLTRSMKVSMTDWHLHRRWSFPVGRMYCCGT